MKTSKVDLYINGTLVNTHPIYPDDISIETERESGEMYRRTNISSTLTFLKADFDAIYNASIDASFEVRFYDAETDTFLARGTFEKTDCKFNLDDRICEVKVSSADDYDKILNGKGNEYDLVSLAPVRESVTLTKRAIIQLYVKGDTKVTNLIGNTSYEIDTRSSVDVGGTSTPVEELSVSEILRFNFYLLKYVLNVSVTPNSAVAALVPQLAGTYTGSSKSGDTSIVLSNGRGCLLTLTQSSSTTPSGYFTWENTGERIVAYGDLCITYKWQNDTFYPEEINNNLYSETGSSRVYRGGTSYQELAFFCRMIYDKPYWATPVKIPENDIVDNNLNYRYVVGFGLAGAASRLKESNVVQDEPTKWGVNGDGKYFVKPTEPSPLQEVNARYIPIGWNLWSPSSYWFLAGSGLYSWTENWDNPFTLKDAYPLWSAIDVLLQKIDPTIRFDGTSTFSQFLYGSISQSVIVAWVSQLLYITPITNVKKTYYNQAARKGTITLEQILNMLKSTCQLYWFIDDDKRLRIEHITWFKNGGNYAQATPLVDLTAIKSPMSKKPWAFNENTIEYDKSLLIKRYEFGWASECTEPFDGYPINIHNGFAKDGNTESASVANFISDIDLIISTPDSLPDDCFALIGTNSNKQCIIADIGTYSMDINCPSYRLQNPYLSFHFLELAYWNYDLGGNYATLEGLKTSQGYEGMLKVYGTKRIKKQSVKFPIVAGNVGKEGLIKTDLGNGEWVKSKYTLEDGMTEMDLIYDTADTSLVSIGEVVKTNSLFTYVAYANGIDFSGNDSAHNGVIYAFVTANRNVTATITAQSEPNVSFGWANTSPLSVVRSNTPTSAKISGDATMVNINMDKGDTLFFGYYNGMPDSEYGDQISVRFYAR